MGNLDTGKAAPYGSGYKKLEERLKLFLEKNVPNDPGKWSYYKSQAKKKFDVELKRMKLPTSLDKIV